MEGCSFVLFLLLAAGGGAAHLRLQRQLDKRLSEVERDLSLLRVRAEPQEVADIPREAAHADQPDLRETVEAPVSAPAPVVEPVDTTEKLEQTAVPETDSTASRPIAANAGSFATAESPDLPKPPEPVSDLVESPDEPAGPPAGPPRKATKPRRPPIRIDWERWIGVRGAAVLGGAVLALAAILFLKYSIEQGLIPPIVRVVLGVVAGLGALGGAETLRKRAYGVTANSLSGAGIVIFYASIWAAHRLYDLIPVSVAFAFFVLVTATCGLLSWRHRSLVIAVLGLVGGFTTPFLLASGRDNPIGLFGYILLLDAGLLVLARKRNWPLLALFGLLGTLVYQALWVFVQMGSENLFLTLLILAVFAMLFSIAGGLGKSADSASTKDHRTDAQLTAVGGVLLPFAFSFYLAARSDLGEHILPIAGLLLLLSAAACWMARTHKLEMLAPGAAAASVAVTAVWSARADFSGSNVWEMLGVACVLGAVFRILAPASLQAPSPKEPETPWRLAQSAPLVSAAGFLFLLLLAPLGASVPHLWPWIVGWLAMSLLLRHCARSAPLAGASRGLILPVAAASQVAAFGIWLAKHTLSTPLAWELVTIAVTVAVFFHWVGPEHDKEVSKAPLEALRSAPLIAACGFFVVLALAPLGAPASDIWPWFAGWTALAAILVFQGRIPERGYRQIAAAALFGSALVLFYMIRIWLDSPPPPATFFALALGVAFAFQTLALARRATSVVVESEMAAAIVPSLLLFGMIIDVGIAYLPPSAFLTVEGLLAGLIALSATRFPSGRLYLGAVVSLAAAHSILTVEAGDLLTDPGLAARMLAIQSGAILLFSFWPFLAGKKLAKSRWALYGSALAGPLWFLSLKQLFLLRFGDRAIGVVPILLGITTFLAALAAKRLWTSGSPEGRRSLVWYLAVTLTFVSVAIPLQLDKEWITVGWALEGLALIALWKRLDHAGLKYFGLALLGAATLRLILNPAVFDYYPRSGQPIFNWLMYTYLVPVAALLLSARSLAGLEIKRLLAWEVGLYDLAKGRAMGAISCGLGAILIGFWWINLTVIDYFSVGARLDLSFERLPARDLSLSLSWAFYALLLLAVGMARRSVGLRWLSLGFLILTIGKVFLYDLGELTDLYRVASLVGLAVSLLVVSLAYQRFVFGRDRDKEES